MMKVGFVSQGMGKIDPPNAHGSISIWTYGVICELLKSVMVVDYEMDGLKFLNSEKLYQGVRYIYAPTFPNSIINKMHNAIIGILSKITCGRFGRVPAFASLWHNFGYILWVAIQLRKEKCDVIHLHQFSQFVPIVRFFNPESKIVLQMHSEWLTQVDRSVIKSRIGKVDLVLGVSEYISNEITKKFPETEIKIATAFCGVDPRIMKKSEIEPPKRVDLPVRLLFVGRVSPEKGVHVLILAMQKVVKKCADVDLKIVGGIGSAPMEFMVAVNQDPKVKGLSIFYGDDSAGESYYYKCLKKMIVDETRSKIHFLGWKAYHQLAEYYQSSDIFIAPSYTEAGATSVIEAMAFENAVIASRVGGINNVVVDRKTGILFDVGDPDGLAEAIVELIKGPSLRVKMGKAGRERVMERYSFEKIAEKLNRDYGLLFNET